MAWHTFETGNTYSTLQALAVCWNRLESGAVADVPDKLKMLEWIRRLAPERVVFAPFSSGWRWPWVAAQTPNQALQQTGAACRLSGVHCR